MIATRGSWWSPAQPSRPADADHARGSGEGACVEPPCHPGRDERALLRPTRTRRVRTGTPAEGRRAGLVRPARRSQPVRAGAPLAARGAADRPARDPSPASRRTCCRPPGSLVAGAAMAVAAAGRPVAAGGGALVRARRRARRARRRGRPAHRPGPSPRRGGRRGRRPARRPAARRDARRPRRPAGLVRRRRRAHAAARVPAGPRERGGDAGRRRGDGRRAPHPPGDRRGRVSGCRYLAGRHPADRLELGHGVRRAVADGRGGGLRAPRRRRWPARPRPGSRRPAH